MIKPHKSTKTNKDVKKAAKPKAKPMRPEAEDDGPPTKARVKAKGKK